MKILIVGSGFSGAVVARQLVDSLGCSAEVWEERGHTAGNCHTERDAATGILIHKYGPHIFNTNNQKVWNYVNRFGEFRGYTNRVKSITPQGVFSMPINLLTINQFFGKSLNPSEAQKFVAELGDKSIDEPKNFEEQALKMLGRELYEAFFKGYTIKQWGCHPRELPASILKRLPVRFNYDDNYYDKLYQGIPVDGYTSVINKILDHPHISIHLNRQFSMVDLGKVGGCFSHIFFTGPIDAFFGYSEGRLGYRTVTFERIETNLEDYQGNAVINYPGEDVPWTRIHEHKHFSPWEAHRQTVAFREFSKETESPDVPYYPKRLPHDITLLRHYRCLAEGLAARGAGTIKDGDRTTSSRPSVALSFLGRLATYRYMDMEAVIGEALEFADCFIDCNFKGIPVPVFPNIE